VVLIAADFERHEVAQVPACGFLQLGEDSLRWAGNAQVDVLGRSRPLDPELEHEAAFEDCGVSEDGNDAREETSEDEELPRTCKLGAHRDGHAKALLERLLAGLG